MRNLNNSLFNLLALANTTNNVPTTMSELSSISSTSTQITTVDQQQTQLHQSSPSQQQQQQQQEQIILTSSTQQQQQQPPVPPPISTIPSVQFHTRSNSGSSGGGVVGTSTRYNRSSIFSTKKSERNFLSAFCSIFSIAVLIVSLIETRWFYLNGGGCNLNYLGVSYFFATGKLETHVELSHITKYDIVVNNFQLPNGFVLKNCANRDILIIMRLIIAFIFIAIISSFIGLIIDTFGFMKNSFLKLVRRHALFHILTVIICLIINGFCFWCTERIYDQQFQTRYKKGKRIDVTFDVSYYLIVLASILSILASAFTLLKRYPTDDDEHLDRLLNEYAVVNGFEDPANMQRSLPANETTIALISQQQQQQQMVQLQQQAPSTPPPPIHNSNRVQQPIAAVSLNEPPPPYLDDDTQPLIIT